MKFTAPEKKETPTVPEKEPHKNPDLPRQTQPQHTGNRQIDNSAAAAQARQTFPTPKDMTYQTPGGALVGKEHTMANGTPVMQTENGQLYRGTLNDAGNITKWQPITADGKDSGKPIAVTSERTGAPPAGTSPEQYVSAPRQTENHKAPEPTKSEPKFEYPKAEAPRFENKFEAPKAEAKNAFEAKEPHNFDAQKNFIERAAQSLAVSVPQEKSEPKTTKVEHVSYVPSPEYQRASNPFNIFAQKLERTIASAPNTVEFGQKFVNELRDSRQMFKPSLETTFYKPETSIQKPEAKSLNPEGLNVKPEPLSGVKFHNDLRTHLVSPLQGLSEPFTFKPAKPISRADIIEQIGDIGKGKIPSVAALVALLLAGRKSDVKEPAPSKAIENVVKPRLEPKLQAVLDKFQQPQKDKLVEIATKVKEGKAEILSTKDFDIAKRVQQLQPKQIDALIAWAQNKSPIKFDILPENFQIKLSSLLETVIKATAVVSDKGAVKADVKPAEKNVLSDKTKPIDEKTAPIDKTKQVEKPVEKAQPTDRTIQVKGAEQETDITVQMELEFGDLPDSEDDDTKPAKETKKHGNLYGLDGPPKRRNRQTKQMVETQENRSAVETMPSLAPSSTLLNDTTRRLESGSLNDAYQIILQIRIKGTWINVLECAVKYDEALYIQHYAKKPDFKHSINVKSKIAQIIQNNFFINWQARINDYFGAKNG